MIYFERWEFRVCDVYLSSGLSPTQYQYTGQYSHTADFGLMYYNARWYDPALGRFTQADSIVPPGVQGLDRYAYVNNNPMRYTDPTGHRSCEEDGYNCAGESKEDIAKSNMANKIHKNFRNIRINNVFKWDVTQLTDMYRALTDIRSTGFNNNNTAFESAFGDVTFHPVASGSLGKDNKGNPFPANAEYGNGIINIAPNATYSNFIHEMGHILDGNAYRQTGKTAPLHSQSFVDQFNTGTCTASPCSGGGWTPSGITTPYGQSAPMEDFADSFLAVIKYGGQASLYVDASRIVIIEALMQGYVDYNPYSSAR